MSESVVTILLIVLGVTTWILWIFLPFAIFGIKTRLDKLIELNEKTVNNLAMLPELMNEEQQGPDEASSSGPVQPSDVKSTDRNISCPRCYAFVPSDQSNCTSCGRPLP